MQKTLLRSFLVLTFLNLTGQAQKETRNWFFATKAGLNFATGTPAAVITGSINNAEGSACMSDSSGSLLFYTDGVTVYNKNHVMMANGNGLFGDYSSTQSALIVKKPGSATLYYIFTTDDGGTGGMNGLNYSIVDMSLAAGLGSVTTKNTNLYAPSCEKLSAVKHCNGTDVWILSHELTTNVFRNFLLTASGVNTTPVLSAVGSTITNAAAIGQMKFSPNGRKLGLAIFDGNIPPQPNPPPNIGGFELYDFDPATGLVSNFVKLHSDWSAYGCEFSQDGTKFYGSLFSGDQMYQWNVCAGSSAAIVASEYTLVPGGSNNNFGSMQLASNGKIYIAQKQKQSLSVINNPNALGSACNYSYLAVPLGQRTADLNLPNFMSSYFKAPSPPFTYSLVSCKTASFSAGPAATVCAAAGFSLSSVQWSFGDPLSGSSNTASGSTPTHTFSSAGNYQVKCIYNYQCSSDTVAMTVTVSPVSAPSLTVAGTFTICKGDVRSYTVSGANTYSWSTNSSSNTVILSPTITSTYSVTGTNTLTGCQSTQVLTLTVKVCSGLNEYRHPEQFSLYPNPGSGDLCIQTSSDLEQITLLVTDLSGKVVYTAQASLSQGQARLHLELANGVYTVSIQTPGATQAHQKLIIQN